MENCIGEDMKQRVVLKPMDAEQLREYGHKVVDFVADYYKSIESFPVLSQPGYLKEILPQSAPSHPEPLEDVLNGSGGGVIQGTANEAVLVDLLGARNHTLRRDGSVCIERFMVYGWD